MKRYSLTCPFDYGKYKEEVRGQLAENAEIEEFNAENPKKQKPLVAVTTLQKVLLSDFACVNVALRQKKIMITREAEKTLANAQDVQNRKAKTKEILKDQKVEKADSDDATIVDDSTLVESISISVPERIVVGDEIDLNVEVAPIDADNTDVSITVSTACVEVGEEAIVAKEAGECVITVAAVDGSDVVATAKVGVVEEAPVKEFVLVLPDKVEAGDKFEIGITIAGDGGEQVVLEDEPTVKFSNKRLAATEDGKIEAVNVGPSVITVTFVTEGEAVKLVGTVEVIAAE